MILVVAEKPSVGQTIADMLGGGKKKSGYIECAGVLVTWCYGHLVENAPPDAYDEAYKSWDVTNLPILPAKFKTVVKPGSGKRQYSVVKNLMNLKEVTEVVEATDAGREGELIFRLVYYQAKCKKRATRLWSSSLETIALKEAWENRRPISDYDAVAMAAYARSRSDWLYGMNLTRLYSRLYAPQEGVYNCGRVQTPLVSLIVERQNAIDAFARTPYWNVILTSEKGRFSARFETEAAAIEASGRARGRMLTVSSYDMQEKKKRAPEPYSMTALAREANRYFGYTADRTLGLLQDLYEMKLSTYPRTGARRITADMKNAVEALAASMVARGIVAEADASALDASPIVDDSKVEDHPALLPTDNLTLDALGKLDEQHRNVMTLIATRLVASMMPPCLYASSKATATIGDDRYEAHGSTMLSLGFKAIEDRMKGSLGIAIKEDESKLAKLSVGEQVKVDGTETIRKLTEPPKPYTDDTLLAAMEACGRNVNDPDARSAMKDKGLGTDATRPGIIEGVVRSKYVKREKKHLVPTEKAFSFMRIVDPKMKSAEMTGEWESELSRIAGGEGSYGAFMQKTADAVTAIVAAEKKKRPSRPSTPSSSLGSCPLCGSDVVKKGRVWSCSASKYDPNTKKSSGCTFKIFESFCGHAFTQEEISSLLHGDATETLNLKKKNGAGFAAGLAIDEDGSLRFASGK